MERRGQAEGHSFLPPDAPPAEHSDLDTSRGCVAPHTTDAPAATKAPHMTHPVHAHNVRSSMPPALIPDPDRPGTFIANSTARVWEDPDRPGTFLHTDGALTENPERPGTFNAPAW